LSEVAPAVESKYKTRMDLFAHAFSDQKIHVPLAESLRPKNLSEMFGQNKILGKESPWLKIFEAGQIPSLILWGPPGTGKTTLAHLIAQKMNAEVVSENAIDLGAKSLREIGEAAKRKLIEYQRKTLLFIDEIHRLNKSQQDILLPYLEKGQIILIGATTENPSYELNAALLSRCRILVFESLSLENLKEVWLNACVTKKFAPDQILKQDAEEIFIGLADGDARRLLNMAELIFMSFENSDKKSYPLSQEGLKALIQSSNVRYDKSSDQHYDVISAFIKSIRGSDPDAGLYYLARMIKGGEQATFIARRLVILASEDISNADPRALSIAVAGLQAVELVGFPEAAISLAQVVTYLACAPKSNRSYLGLKMAQEAVEQTGTLPVPLALRSSKTQEMKSLGYGKGYRYSHDSQKGYIRQDFLPEKLIGSRFYEPSEHGFEKTIKQYLEWLKN
jgi:putative ATPase